MLKFFQKKICPVGIDLGRDGLKILQLGMSDKKPELIAAARAQVPPDVQGNANSLYQWYGATIKKLLGSKPFKGKKIVSCLPSREMIIQHLRIVKMDEKDLQQALPFEMQDKLPFDANQALLRHIVAGEVYDEHTDQAKLEVILMAASGMTMRQHLNLIEHSKMEIDSINVEPCALARSFTHLLSGDGLENSAVMLVDLGHSCTKATIMIGSEITFCRTVNISSIMIRKAISEQLTVNYDQAVLMHYNYELENPDATAAVNAGQNAGAVGAVAATVSANNIIDQALANLAEELRGCIRYHNLMFENNTVAKVIFVGGQAKNTNLCQRLAQNLGLPAQIGDPLAGIDNIENKKISDLDPNSVNSDWAVAFGLGLM